MVGGGDIVGMVRMRIMMRMLIVVMMEMETGRTGAMIIDASVMGLGIITITKTTMTKTKNNQSPFSNSAGTAPATAAANTPP